MRRFRVLFAVLSLAILAPLALLAERAVRSLWLERQIRQRTVAERIFDEMERGLSRLLETEEQQPFDRYGTDVPPREPAFVIGRFQVDPDDSVHALPMNAPPGERVAELLSAVGAYWRAASGAKTATNAVQLPG